MKKIWSLVLSVIAIVVISGCGGGGGSPGKSLVLTVGSKKIKSSNTERETIRIKNDTRSVATVNINDPFCDISLGGNDADQFKYDSDRLSFKESVDIFNPRDYDKDNGYELDITASCDDGRSITYKVEYKVTSDEDFLKGHTYYVVNGENNYTKYGFADDVVTLTTYTITKTSEENHNEVGSNTYSIKYTDTTFSYNGQTCKLISSDPLKARCGAKTIELLKDKPKYVVPSSYYAKVKVPDDIHYVDDDQDDKSQPRIEGFEMAGNSPAESNRVIIDKSKADHSFSYTIKINSIYTKYVYSGLEDANSSWKTTINGSLEETISYDCKYLDDNNGIRYKCTSGNYTLELDTNSSGDTNMLAVACDKNISDNTRKCSYTSLPVLFR